MVIRQSFLLGNEGNHILPETVHPHVQPEPQNLLHFFPHQWIVHIQVCLLHRKQVHVVLLTDFIPGPGLALKKRIPVVGQFSVCLGRTPDVVVGVGLNSLAALLEPFMLGAGVIHHQIHNYLHTPLMGTIQHLPECIQTAEFLGNVIIVGDIVAAVHTGGRIQRRKPDAVAAKRPDIVQFFVNTQQVAHAITVSVFKGSGPNLIKHFVFVPLFLFHRNLLYENVVFPHFQCMPQQTQSGNFRNFKESPELLYNSGPTYVLSKDCRNQ